ncbi:hypothetical protein OAC63_04320 [Amylibacter sp.]|nr:hypothetical protein [Amylibacter sp.]
MLKLALVVLFSSALPNSALAQSVNLTPAPISEHNALISDWQNKRDALKTALETQTKYEKETEALTQGANAQQAKIDAAKEGLSSAVLKVAGAKKKLSQVDTSDADPKGQELSSALVKSQTDLNTVITTSETLRQNIEAMKIEHEKLRSTADKLKSAAAAAQAAVSAAEVLVEAVKSAQLVISEGEDGNESDLDTDFFKDAVSQAENARKSEAAAKVALAATRKRQIAVGERLLTADEQLENAKISETSYYEKFAAADAAFKKHQAERKVKIDARNNLIAQITEGLNAAQSELEAQQAILQNESLTMQDFSAKQTTASNKLSDLQSNVDRAQIALNTAQATLRVDQKKRSIEAAAIVANLNAEMRNLLAPSVPNADTTTSTDRILIPSSILFSKNSAKQQKSNGVKLNEVAAILKDTTSRIPDGIEWIIRVDSYGTGKTDEAWFLSQNRPLSVAQSLITNGRFGGTKVSANGLINAKSFSDATENGWIEIVLTAR